MGSDGIMASAMARPKRTMALCALIACALATGCGGSPPPEPAARWPAKTYYRTVEVAGQRMFYREAGPPGAPTIVLLHGYPSSSHTYRELIPLLSGRFHVIAPDNLGSGFSARPDVPYDFDLLAAQIAGLLDALRIERAVFYLQDFGAPVGFRVMLARPERVRGLIVQNANAYLDGLTPPRQAFFRAAHDDRSPAMLERLTAFVSDDAIREKQYLRDVPGERAARMSPDAWTHDIARLSTARDRAIQVQLFQDYQTNIDAYPRWQAWLRSHRPPTLVVWGARDPAFVAAGAEAYRRDVPDAEVHLLDAGHFAAEELPVAIARHIVAFMARLE